MQKSNGFTKFLIIGFSLVLFSVCAFAQDSGSPSFDAYDRPDYEPIYLSGGGEGDTIQSRSKSKQDSIALSRTFTKPNYRKPYGSPKDPPKGTSDEPTDNSLLSFNFLYYLIQKYKMQDIVD